MYFLVELECSSRQSPEQNCGESHQISTTSVGRYVQNLSPHRRSAKTYLAEVNNNFNNFIYLITLVTFLINQRPLYPSSNEIWGSPPITPNDLLIENHFPPPMTEVESKVNPRHLMSSTEKRVLGFWNCWMKYFAPNLLPRNKWFRKRENLRKGDLVLEI